MILFIRDMMVYPPKIFDFLFKAGSVNTIIILGVYLFRLAPIYLFLFLQHLLILITIPVILKSGITEVKKYHNKEMRKVIIGFALLSLCVIAALGLFYVNSSLSYAYLYSVGFILFMSCLTWAVFGQIYAYLEESAKTVVYREMTYMDSMTGLENRSAFEKILEKQTSAAGATYIVFDNNNLKKVNDQHGHQEGDQLLIDTADCIKKTFQRIGRCFRIGGDKFLVILNDMPEEEVLNVLKYFDRKMSEINSRRNIPIEVAYGYFSCMDASVTSEELFKKADANMYSKKQEMKSGRESSVKIEGTGRT